MLIPSEPHAKDYETPHILNPGELLSADVFNENFDEIRKARESFKAEDLIGIWECIGYQKFVEGYQPPPENPLILSDDGLIFKSLPVDICFDDEIFYSENAPLYPFHHTNLGPCTWTTRANVLFYKDMTGRILTYHITKISDARITLELISTDYYSDEGYSVVVICDKISIPPANPKELAAIVIESDAVTLEWIDTSENESGFKIFCKYSIGEKWVKVIEVGMDMTQVTHNANGERWYRIKSYNEYGDSIGSNVVLVQP